MANKTLYKYKTYNKWAIDSLKHKYFYFSRPDELDDPFDCKVIPTFENTTDEEIQSWIDSFSNYQHTTFPYKTVSEVRIAIENGELDRYFTCSDEIFDKYHILSLCASRINQNLWSLYSDVYKGLCIGYSVESDNDQLSLITLFPEKPNPLFRPVVKSHSTEKFCSLSIKEIEYVNTGLYSYNWINQKFYSDNVLLLNGNESLEDKKEIARRVIYTKNNFWKVQNEYRVMYNHDERDYSKIYYSDNVLKNITFGYRMTKENRKEIYELIEKNYSNFKNIDFNVIEPNFKTGKLKLNVYNPND